VSVVAVKLITFQCFDKIQYTFFLALSVIISDIPEAMYTESEMNVDHFSGSFQILGFETTISVLKAKSTKFEGGHSVVYLKLFLY